MSDDLENLRRIITLLRPRSKSAEGEKVKPSCELGGLGYCPHTALRRALLQLFDRIRC